MITFCLLLWHVNHPFTEHQNFVPLTWICFSFSLSLWKCQWQTVSVAKKQKWLILFWKIRRIRRKCCCSDEALKSTNGCLTVMSTCHGHYFNSLVHFSWTLAFVAKNVCDVPLLVTESIACKILRSPCDVITPASTFSVLQYHFYSIRLHYTTGAAET